MTYIKELVLDGFKSFAKETRIPFEPSLNIIVGPNGSGKSNISDAICFVLGRLSIKSIRAAKAANLIFNGGKTARPASEAKVELVLDNSDKTFALDAQEVKISRLVRRDGQSIYKINGQAKTRQQVLDLLAQAGIDPYGFNIILQGEIARFVEMSGEERRQVIEEIAGISIYEIRKQQALRELEKTEQKLSEVNTILKERAAFMHNLEEERRQALRYKQLEQLIKQDKASLLFRAIKEKQHEKDEIEKKIVESGTAANKLRTEILEIQNAISDINNDIENINKNIETASGIEQERLRNELVAVKTEIAALQVSSENLATQLKQLDNRNAQLNKDIARGKEELKKLQQLQYEETKKAKTIDLAQFKQSLFELASKLDGASKEITEINSTAQKEFQKHKELLLNFLEKKQPDKAYEQLDLLISVVDKLTKKSSNISSNVAALRNELQQLLKAKIGEESEEKNLSLEIALKQQELERMALIIKQGEKEKSNIEQQFQKLQKLLEEKKQFAAEQESKEEELKTRFQQLFSARNELHEKLRKNEAQLVKYQAELATAENELNNLKIVSAEKAAQLSALQEDFKTYEGVGIIKKSSKELEDRLKRHEALFVSIGTVNLRALQVYESLKGEYEKIREKVEKLQQEKTHILKIIEEIDKKKRITFVKTLDIINKNFSQNFSRVSAKGTAFLELENKEKPFEGGLDIVIKLGKGKYFDVHSLSGGEQTLVALSLIFAIQEYKPHCFYILDEIDAALDKRNS